MTDPTNVPPTPPTPAPLTVAAPAYSPRWGAVVGAFAATIGLTLEGVTAKLLSDAVNVPDDDALAVLASATDMPDSTWAEMFPSPSVKRPLLNRAVAALRTTINGVVPVAPAFSGAPGAAAPGTPGGAPGTAAMFGVQLEPLADDQSFLAALVTGGRLNGTISPNDAAVAVRVSLAATLGLFTVPDRLVERIEATAEAQETPADSAAVYELIDSITSREYGPLLRALGVPQRAIGSAERKKFQDRCAATLFPGLRRFHAALASWHEQFKSERSDPSLLIQAITGGLGGMLPTVTTDTSVLRSAVADLMTTINRLFAGLNALPAARSMAQDAVRILTQLNDPRYVTAAGFTTRDEMFRGLNISVTEHYARVERTLGTYVINAMRIPTVTDQQLPYLAQQLYQIGQSIPWADLGGAASTGDGPRLEGGRGGNGKAKGGSDPFRPFPPYNG